MRLSADAPRSRLRTLPWIAILLLAAALRAPSLTAARPYIGYVDEGNYLHPSARMLREGTWIPDDFSYPSLPITAVAAAARAYDPVYRSRHGGHPLRSAVLTRYGGYYDVLEPFEILFLGRTLGFLAGLGVVLLSGLLARRVAGSRAGLLAAFAAALLPSLVARGGIATVDPFATLFATACLLFTDRVRTSGRPVQEALLAGAMAGLTFASKYPAVLVSLAFALTVGLSRSAWRERLRLWTIGAAGAIGAALLAMPGLATDPQGVLRGMSAQAAFYRELTSPSLGPQAVEQAEWDLPLRGPELGWTFLALAAAGLAVALRDRRTRPAAAGWTLFLVLALALYTRQSFTPFRNLLPLLPIGCVAVAILLARLRTRIPGSPAAGFVLLALLFGPQGVRFVRERARFEDSRTQAIDWLARNSRPGQTVLVLRDLAFLPSEIGRLAGRNVRVQDWDRMRKRLFRRRVRYLVLTQMSTAEGRPLLSEEGVATILKHYEPRARYGEEAITSSPVQWHGNRQLIVILERRPPQPDRTPPLTPRAAASSPAPAQPACPRETGRRWPGGGSPLAVDSPAMKTHRTHWILAGVLGLALAREGAWAVEGKWTPEQILEHDPRWLKKLGLEIPPSSLWGRDGAGLLDAAVLINGCSAGFVSRDGLMITNHHCAFAALQQHSTPERDLITRGFLAATRSEELSGAGIRATIPHRTRDVTAEVEAAVPAGADDLARFYAIERKKKELIAACEAQPNRRCRVEAFDDGVKTILFENLEYPDVRLVYAPPRAIGEYGGEVDNWSWPRHTGDYALLRVYSGPDGNPAPMAPANVPYHPRHFFPVARRGVQEGDFVMLAGYPGYTFRSFTEPEMRERGERTFPQRAALYRAWIDRMEEAAARDEVARIALADRIKALANREKNSRGQVEGLRRGHILERKGAEDRAVLDWAAGRPEQKGAVAAYQELADLVARRQGGWMRDFLVEQARNGPKPLDMALTLARWATEKKKPDLDREPDYMQRSIDRKAEQLERDQKRFHRATEAVLLADVLGRFAALPAEARLPAVEALLGGNRSEARIRAQAESILASTRVLDAAERQAMFAESEEQLQARRDPLLDLAFALDRELLALKKKEDRFKGAASRLRPQWRRAVQAHAGKPVAFDANGTLRVTLAHVQGYAPRDGVWMRPQTTLAGLVEKNTGEEPFAAPPELLREAAAAARSRWADPKLHDVPVCFLADADTTGGNSGSPVVNGRGELVGVNFDRVWENVANDFGYNPEVARNVTADVRYLLWLLESGHGAAAKPLLDELGAEAPAGASRP